MAEHSSPALVLRLLDYGEADRIVTLFTPELGRIKGFARHARKSRKRFGAALELFTSVEIFWGARQRGDLLRLESVESKALRIGLRNRLEAFALASYASELIELFLAEGQAQPELYELLTALLDHLEQGGDVPTARLLYELRLVDLLGYRPHFRRCGLCGAGVGHGRVRFDLHSGGAVCPDCSGRLTGLEVSAGTLGSLARCAQTDPTRFADIRLGPVTLEEGGRILQQVLASHWSRSPRSLDFLNQMVPVQLP